MPTLEELFPSFSIFHCKQFESLILVEPFGVLYTALFRSPYTQRFIGALGISRWTWHGWHSPIRCWGKSHFSHSVKALPMQTGHLFHLPPNLLSMFCHIRRLRENIMLQTGLRSWLLTTHNHTTQWLWIYVESNLTPDVVIPWVENTVMYKHDFIVHKTVVWKWYNACISCTHLLKFILIWKYRGNKFWVCWKL